MSARDRIMLRGILTPWWMVRLYGVVAYFLSDCFALRKQMVWDGIHAVEISGVDVWVVFVLFAGWVVLDVQKLTVVVVGISNVVLVIAAVPDFSRGVLAGCERISAFDVLDAL